MYTTSDFKDPIKKIEEIKVKFKFYIDKNIIREQIYSQQNLYKAS